MDTRKAALIQSVKLMFILAAVTLVYSVKSYNFIQVKEIIFSLGVAVLILTLFAMKEIHVRVMPFLILFLPAWHAVSASAGAYKFASGPPLAVAASLAVFFIAAANTEWDLKRLRGAVITASAPAVIIGLIQALFPAVMKEFLVFGSRVPSLLGNPNFFGAFLAGTAPLALAGVMEEKGVKRVLYALFFLAAVFCILATGSKAALAALAFIAAWPCLIFIRKNRDVKKSLVIAACLVSIAMVAAIAVMGYRLSKTADRVEWAKNESVFFRAYTWLGTLGIIRDNPVFGTGPGSFSIVYPQYRKPEIMLWTHEHSYETTQPENIMLQLAAETGLPGLAIAMYLLFFVIKKARQEHNEFLTGILAVFLVNLAGVDLNYITSSMLVVLYGGVIISSSGGTYFTIKSVRKNLYTTVLLAPVIMSGVFQLNRHISMVYLKQGVYYSQTQQWATAIDNYKKALEKDKYCLPARYFLANSYYDSRAEKGAFGLEEYIKLEKLAPNYILLHYNEARVYSLALAYDRAIEEYQKMLKIDPYLKPALVDLAQLYTDKKQMYAEAENCLKRAVEAYPEDASLYNNLGNVYFMAKKPDEAILSFKKAVDLKQDKDYYYNLGCVYFTLNDLQNADFYLKKALEMAPGDRRTADMLMRVKAYRPIK